MDPRGWRFAVSQMGHISTNSPEGLKMKLYFQKEKKHQKIKIKTIDKHQIEI